MPNISITVGTITGTANFTAAQADKLLGPILPSLGWTGPITWTALNATDKQVVCDLLAVWLRRVAAKEARSLYVATAAVAAKANAETDYDSTMSELLL